MAAHIKTLKEDNGDITYPQTKAGAVYTDEGSDVQTVLDDCTRFEELSATSPLTPLVTKGMVDWTTMQPTISSFTTPTAGSWLSPTWYMRTYPDGRVIYTTIGTSILLSFNSLGWGSANSIRLPVAFDASKMAISVNCAAWDSAISLCNRVLNTGDYVITHWVNNYSGAVNTYVDFNVTLEVFPN